MALFGNTVVRSDRDALFDAMGQDLLKAAQSAVEERGVFHLALSGGSTPEPFYVHLVIDPDFRALPWQQTQLWIVDERRVPVDDERSNFRMIREALVDHVPMKSRQLHPMPVMQEDPASVYEQELRAAFGDEEPKLDFVLLGMGDDAHTASLFPGSEALHVMDRLIAVNDGANVTPPPRVTMTYPLLNASRQTGVLVMGEKKAATIAKVRAAVQPQIETLPITGVRPEAGLVTWYLDDAAAG